MIYPNTFISFDDNDNDNDDDRSNERDRLMYIKER